MPVKTFTSDKGSSHQEKVPKGWVLNLEIPLHVPDTMRVIVILVDYDLDQWDYELVQETVEQFFMNSAIQNLDERVIAIKIDLTGLNMSWLVPEK